MTARRGQIAITDAELAAYLAGLSVLIVATVGKDGLPHLTAVWYVLRDGEPWIFTYARSQKGRNGKRDRSATLLLESGAEYAELRGAVLVRPGHDPSRSGGRRRACCANHNSNPQPFQWTATADQILAKVRRGRVTLDAITNQN